MTDDIRQCRRGAWVATMNRLCAHCVDAADEVPGMCPVEHVPCGECSRAWPAENHRRPPAAAPPERDDYEHPAVRAAEEADA